MDQGHDDSIQPVGEDLRKYFGVNIEEGNRAVRGTQSRVLPRFGDDHYHCIPHCVREQP